MLLKKIQVENFRNLEKKSLLVHPQINIFFGENAQGKTSFLESLYFCLKGTSFRLYEVEKLINKERSSQGCSVCLDVDKKGLDYEVLVKLEGRKKKNSSEWKSP